MITVINGCDNPAIEDKARLIAIYFKRVSRLRKNWVLFEYRDTLSHLKLEERVKLAEIYASTDIQIEWPTKFIDHHSM